jgi:hypothetical protein
MKTKTIIFIVTLCAATTFFNKSYGQYNDGNNRGHDQRTGSVQLLKDEQSVAKANDETRMRDAKEDREASKAKAKEANRIGKEASDAARESNNALKAEKRAQKARKQADKQAVKAAKSRSKSDQN